MQAVPGLFRHNDVARFGILHDNVASLDAFDVRIKPELAVDTPVSLLDKPWLQIRRVHIIAHMPVYLV